MLIKKKGAAVAGHKEKYCQTRVFTHLSHLYSHDDNDHSLTSKQEVTSG